MPRRVKPLNAKQIAAWKPDPIRTLELPDGALPGLWVRLTPSGDISWSLNVRVHGVRRRIAVGRKLGLAEARRRAEALRVEIASGIDPTEERKTQDARRKAAVKGVGTLQAVIASYYETGPGAGLLSRVAARVMIERVLKPHLPRPALDVTSAQLQLTIDAYGSKSSAQHAAGYFRPVMRWACKRGLMTKGDLLEAPRQAQVRQRKLTHEEVGRVWGELGWYAHDIAARFMLVTGARREEVCGATWAEVDLERARWTLPAARRKDTRTSTRRVREDHVIALSRQAVAVLERLGPGKPDDLVFIGHRAGRLSNWPRWSAGREKGFGFDVTPHALRRTCATLAGDLGQPPHVVSALLGHRSIGGSLHSGYNQSRYLTEVAQTLQLVADFIETLAVRKDNVITIQSKRNGGTG